ncbi:MAG: TolC family protein [Gemmatimonadales bacterium]
MHALRLCIALVVLPASLLAQSLTLDATMRAAVRRDGVARNAALDVTRSEAFAREIRAGLLPSVTARATAVRRTVNPDAFGIFSLPARATDPFTVLDARAAARIPLLDLAALGRWRAARLDVDAIAGNAARSADTAALAAAVAYVRVAHAEALVAARRQDVLLSRDLLSVARERVDAGIAPNIDATRAGAQLAESEALAAGSEADVERARIALESALDDPALAKLPLTDSLDRLASTDSLDESAAIGLARAQRSEITAASARVNAARQRAGAVGAEWIPSIGLVGDVGQIGRAGNRLVTTWQAGIEVSISLLDGFSRQARGAAGAAVLEQAELGQREVLRAIDLEVRAAMAGTHAIAAQVRASRLQVQLGEQEVDQARTRFTAGVAGNGDVVGALTALSRARTSLANALAAQAIAQLAVAAATGSLTPR